MTRKISMLAVALLTGTVSILLFGADAPKAVPVSIGLTREACTVENGKLKAEKWEDCANGLLQAAANLEKQRDACLATSAPKKVEVPPVKKK